MTCSELYSRSNLIYLLLKIDRLGVYPARLRSVVVDIDGSIGVTTSSISELRSRDGKFYCVDDSLIHPITMDVVCDLLGTSLDFKMSDYLSKVGGVLCYEHLRY